MHGKRAVRELRVVGNECALPPLELAMGLINSIIQNLEVTHEPNLTLTKQLITNDDLLPVESETRTWHGSNYVAFWMADMFNMNIWGIVSNVVVASPDMRWPGYGIATRSLF
ncbi:hypothetical protein C8R48DRAFT_773910 [Suillus tomentosus]|nr:hypothetical protein C8R48DRAFT_773910 [Suillus tomentosus]